MALVVARDDIKPGQAAPRVGRGGPGITTDATFFRAVSDTPDAPSAYMVRYGPDIVSSAHYHVADEFQIVMAGKGKFGRHEVEPYCVHFARAYTPYGPLVSDKDGMVFMTLRTRYDPGAERPLDNLKHIPDRRPWQVSKKVSFSALASGTRLEAVPAIKDDQGLFVCALTMAPHIRIAAPDPSRGDGQFVVVVKGSLVHDNRERKSPTVAFVKPKESAFEIHSGAQGLEALVLNLPQVKTRALQTKAPSTVVGFKKWQCALCSFAYDEALGLPEENIPAGTRWADVPNTWTCPDCSASKCDFAMCEV